MNIKNSLTQRILIKLASNRNSDVPYYESLKGGQGSGNFGHAGRPGEVGGSSRGASGSLGVDKTAEYDGAINHLLGIQFGKHYYDSAGSNLKRGEIKDDIVRTLSKASGLYYDAVNECIATWRGDRDGLGVNLIQKAVAEEFGKELPPFFRRFEFLGRDFTEAEINDRLEMVKKYDSLQAEINALDTEAYAEPTYSDERHSRLAKMREKMDEQAKLASEMWRDPTLKRMGMHAVLPSLHDDKSDFSETYKIWAEQTRQVETKYFLGDNPHLGPTLDDVNIKIKSIVRAMYDNTQAQFKSFGYSPDDEFVLYRGTQQEFEPGTLKRSNPSPIESWTPAKYVADGYASGSTIKGRIKVKNILGTCLTGFGCSTQGEIIAFGDSFEEEWVGDEHWRRANKGGAGSGNFGHAGRPGEVGGSARGSGVLGKKMALESGQPVNIGERPPAMVGQEAQVQEQVCPSEHLIDLLNEGLDPENGQPGKPYRTNRETRAIIKNEIVTKLAEESGIPYEDVNKIIAQWQHTSSKAVASMDIQEACIEEFGGAGLSEWQIQQKVANQFAQDEALRLHKGDDVGAKMAEHWNFPLLPRPQMRKLLRTMYNITQRSLKEAGAGEYVNLMRGTELKINGDWGEHVEYKGNAIESWTIDATTAFRFGSTHIGMRVPRRNILCSARTGFGCLPEAEFVVIATPTAQATIIDP